MVGGGRYILAGSEFLANVGGSWWVVMDIFWQVVGGGGSWWVVVDIFGWRWMVGDGGGHILAGGRWWWIYFGWWWVVVCRSRL